MATVETTVKRTLMNVPRIPARMMETVQIKSTPMIANATLVTMEKVAKR